MAISYDASAKTLNAANTTHTLSHTVSTGDKRFLVACIIFDNTSSTTISGTPTFNGDNLTSIVTFDTGLGLTMAMYQMTSPDVATGNVSFTLSASRVAALYSASFFGVNDVTTVLDSDTETLNSGSITGTALDTTGGAWTFAFYHIGQNGRDLNVGTTTRQEQSTAAQFTGTSGIGTSGPHTAGTYSETASADGSANQALISFSFASTGGFIPKVMVI